MAQDSAIVFFYMRVPSTQLALSVPRPQEPLVTLQLSRGPVRAHLLPETMSLLRATGLTTRSDHQVPLHTPLGGTVGAH